MGRAIAWAGSSVSRPVRGAGEVSRLPAGPVCEVPVHTGMAPAGTVMR